VERGSRYVERGSRYVRYVERGLGGEALARTLLSSEDIERLA
jgi:hypothetical protein